MGERAQARKYYPAFDAAITDSNLPLENVPLAREVAAAIPHDTVYIPQQTKAYIALRLTGERRLAATIKYGEAWIRDDLAPLLGEKAVREGGHWFVPFPVNRATRGQRSGSRGGEAFEPPICDMHFLRLPATGICDECED